MLRLVEILKRALPPQATFMIHEVRRDRRHASCNGLAVEGPPPPCRSGGRIISRKAAQLFLSSVEGPQRQKCLPGARLPLRALARTYTLPALRGMISRRRGAGPASCRCPTRPASASPRRGRSAALRGRPPPPGRRPSPRLRDRHCRTKSSRSSWPSHSTGSRSGQSRSTPLLPVSRTGAAERLRPL